jgi:hypothetical protein
LTDSRPSWAAGKQAETVAAHLVLWAATDGAYAKKGFLMPVKALGMTVVSRLRCDAALWSLPPAASAGQRGPRRPRVYGTERVSLARRADQRRGWTTEDFTLYGERVTHAVQDVPGDLEAGRRGVVRCWARRFVRFYSRGPVTCKSSRRSGSSSVLASNAPASLRRRAS